MQYTYANEKSSRENIYYKHFSICTSAPSAIFDLWLQWTQNVKFQFREQRIVLHIWPFAAKILTQTSHDAQIILFIDCPLLHGENETSEHAVSHAWTTRE